MSDAAERWAAELRAAIEADPSIVAEVAADVIRWPAVAQFIAVAARDPDAAGLLLRAIAWQCERTVHAPREAQAARGRIGGQAERESPGDPARLIAAMLELEPGLRSGDLATFLDRLRSRGAELGTLDVGTNTLHRGRVREGESGRMRTRLQGEVVVDGVPITGSALERAWSRAPGRKKSTDT